MRQDRMTGMMIEGANALANCTGREWVECMVSVEAVLRRYAHYVIPRMKKNEDSTEESRINWLILHGYLSR